MSNLKIVRLLSGEELMGDVTVNEDKSVLIKEVCQIATSYADPSEATAKIGIAPYLPYADIDTDGIEIGPNYIGFIVHPVTQLLNEYNKIFGSGLIVPDSGISTSPGQFVKG